MQPTENIKIYIYGKNISSWNTRYKKKKKHRIKQLMLMKLFILCKE